MSVLADPAERSDRAARARAALLRAEERTGVRRHDARPALATASRATASRAAAPRAAAAPGPAVGPVAAPEVVGSAVRPVPPARRRVPAAPRTAVPDERSWPVHEDLAPLLPAGALERGTVLAVRGSTSLLLALVAGASAAGAWTTAVGFPEVGLLAAADAGVDLGRLALVPRPGPDAAVAVAALVDGMDVVVVGPAAALTDADRRRVVARARERGTVLVAAATWPGAHVALTVTGGAWSGADRGAGWLRRRTLHVERAGRAGAARPARLEVELPVGRAGWPAYLLEREAARDVARDAERHLARRGDGPEHRTDRALAAAGAEQPGLRLVG
ncbi:hypothetical protein [Cellulosimicrobium sp. CUA-896]|uniref:hypothetical protein n=1 Tax=Cellulosimicrobium sp. CUA-896 TaxID=1517881 RepID=UPI00095BD10A|nr:hypothetical protein [Cellulosimicrobium sp. CUA-896]OLT55228.1 hypothetical protein BJF88_07310 [Cellulosimicrobium sp. CUA-896]